MIEYDETEQLSVTDEELRLVRLFCGDEVGEKLWYRWNDRHTYSDELQQIIEIITGGHEPGKGEAV
jgi:hypothetical protein